MGARAPDFKPPATPPPISADQIEGLRPYLLRYATLQLRDAAAAEDAVQEALLAALAGEANFAGRSNLRTWLTGILKHKIVDTIRRQSRERPAADLEPGEPTTEEFDALFDRRGHWEEAPDAWEQPEGAARPEAVPRRARSLPARAARAHRARLHDARAPRAWRRQKSVRNSESPRPIAG